MKGYVEEYVVVVEGLREGDGGGRGGEVLWSTKTLFLNNIFSLFRGEGVEELCGGGGGSELYKNLLTIIYNREIFRYIIF